MSKFYESSDFKKINEEWKDKLREDGFKDIESNENYISKQTFNVNAKRSFTEEYYILCQKILSSYQFSREIDKHIFQLHADGKSLREIAEDLSNTFPEESLKYRQVDCIIKNVLHNYGPIEE